MLKNQQKQSVTDSTDFSTTIARLELFKTRDEKPLINESTAMAHGVRYATRLPTLNQGLNDLLDKGEFPNPITIAESIRKLGSWGFPDYAIGLFNAANKHQKVNDLTWRAALDAIAKMDVPDLNAAEELLQYAHENSIPFSIQEKTKDNFIDLHGISFGMAYFGLREAISLTSSDQPLELNLIYGKGSHSRQTLEKDKHPLKSAVEKAINDVRKTDTIEILSAEEDQENPGRFRVSWKHKPQADLDTRAAAEDHNAKSHNLLETIHWLENSKQTDASADKTKESSFYNLLVNTHNVAEMDRMLTQMMEEKIVPDVTTLKTCAQKLRAWNENGFASDIEHIVTNRERPPLKHTRGRKKVPARTAPHAVLFQNPTLPKMPSSIAGAHQDAASSVNRTLSLRKTD